ncbi:tyrosinase family protein [Rhodopirellula baltica]|uniref:Tyrosinase n=1 Tax=Rhodopirellula baltica SWK14 TaxID=993516 RepID=L7C916_RHOBT|nr:tyrosinase family protein [Rhodopirellula baltica]ELP30152.1 tyrosinase [Rhodopirellula baltica SWK14]
MNRCTLILSFALFGFAVRAQDGAPIPETRMDLRNFAEYQLFVDGNGDGVVDDTEDKRSPEAKQRLASLRKGVRVMKSRKPSDPKSWFFQSAIHGVTDQAIIEAADRDPDMANVQREMFWNRCPHNGEPSADFLVWHRAYLYYFERILREAADDPTLSLPYWNYTGGDLSFPAAFARSEAARGDIIPRNPLWASDREAAFVVGRTGLTAKVTTEAFDNLMAETQMFGPSEDTGFAGGVYDDTPGTMGMIERRPHNDIHVAIGGVIGDDFNGLMAEVRTAAFDPIFWVHHTNIDRIFAIWDATPGRTWGYFPDAAWFAERPWYFHDVDGSIKNEQRIFYLNGKNLNVSYDDVDVAAATLTESPPFDLKQTSVMLATLPKNFQMNEATGDPTSSLEPMCDCCRQKGIEATLSADAATELDLNIVGTAAESQKLMGLTATVERPKRGPQTMLEITFTPPEFAPNVGYEVFLKVGQSKEISVGSLSLFGLKHHAEHSERESKTVTQRLNITKAISDVTDNGGLKVVIKPYSLFSDNGDPAARRGGDIGVTNVAIRVE